MTEACSIFTIMSRFTQSDVSFRASSPLLGQLKGGKRLCISVAMTVFHPDNGETGVAGDRYGRPQSIYAVADILVSREADQKPHCCEDYFRACARTS